MAKKQAAAVSASDLVRMALLNVANATGDVKLSGKGGLFSSATGANKEAIDECLSTTAPLLTVLRTEGKSQFVGLAPAGFERIARELPDEKVGPLAKAVAVAVPLAARAEFLQAVISRTPLASAELLPVIEQTVAAERAEQEARVEAAKKRREAEQAARVALEHALALFEERRQNRLDALRREYEIEGGKAGELTAFATKTEPQSTAEPASRPHTMSQPQTGAENDYRRDVADQLTASWRDACDAGKGEGREYLEAAIWNIRGMKQLGEVGRQVTFDGLLHESKDSLFTGDAAKVVRPGWSLVVDDENYVPLKALVEKV